MMGRHVSDTHTMCREIYYVHPHPRSSHTLFTPGQHVVVPGVASSRGLSIRRDCGQTYIDREIRTELLRLKLLASAAPVKIKSGYMLS